MITVAIYLGGHDLSITILENEKLLHILQENRFSRIKYDDLFPLKSIEKLPTLINHIDNLVLCGVATSNKYLKIYIVNWLTKHNLTPKHIHIFPPEEHHIFHAASAFYGSGLDNAACLSIDGWGGGEFINNSSDGHPANVTTSIYYASYPSIFETKYLNFQYDALLLESFFEKNLPKKPYKSDYHTNLDIGNLYYTVSNFLGFPEIGDAGKVMGLSSYGKFNSKIPPILYNNTLYANANVFRSDRTVNTKLNPILQKINKELAQDLAYAVQEALNTIFIERIKQTLDIVKTNNIVFSGGCALNVIGNYQIKKHFPKINFYIDPIANDSCISYGAAKLFYYQLTNSKIRSPLETLYQGPRYSKQDLLNSIQKYV